MARKKKTLDKISVGDLKLMDAQLVYRIQTVSAEIEKISTEITANLQLSRETDDEYRQTSIAREITAGIQQQRNLFEFRETLETKRQILRKLISMKEIESPMFSKKHDLFTEIDFEDIESVLAKTEIEREVDKEKSTRILQELGNETDYAKVLAIVRSAAFDGESIVCAKAELDNLIVQPTE